MCCPPNEKSCRSSPTVEPAEVPSEDRIARRHPVSGPSRCFGSPTISRPAGGVSRLRVYGVYRVAEGLKQVSDGIILDHEGGRDP